MFNWFSIFLTLALMGGVGESAQAATPLTTIRVASGLSNPVFVTHAPGDHDRLFILEQRGRIRILKDAQILPTSFLDISTQVSLGGEQGLLGLAFHPDFANNRQFYVNYTNTAGDTVVARYTASESDPNRADPTGDTILFVDQPFVNHNGGWIDFGPDGYLYVALGDGGDQADPNNRGQSITGELLGNILRIDVNQDSFPADELRDYGIPPDNPFVGRTGEDEIWAYGLRNPWRNAFDTKTGDLWIADVGQGDWEEVNYQPASSQGGENYGWDCREGLQCTTFSECNCATLPTKLPIHVYSHDTGEGHCSITGGLVYRGCEIPDLDGAYFFADFCSGQIWSLTYDGAIAWVTNRTAELAPASPLAITSISSFGTDAAGEIYFCDRASLTGEIYKIVPATGSPQLIGSDPPDGSIDARTPLAFDGITKRGINTITLFFDQQTHCTSPNHFRVEQQGGASSPPLVSAVQSVPNNGVQVSLSRPVDPLAWTTLTHEPTKAAVRIGFLPGDVNSDGYSGARDILELIDFLNAVGPARQIWSTDLDRSGSTRPTDLIMLIDLLNGAGNLDMYNGARLP
jgi:glucose/arabinose dehydrogenase